MDQNNAGSATGIDLSAPTTLWRVIFPDGVAVLMDTEPADIFKPHATAYRATPQHSVTEQVSPDEQASLLQEVADVLAEQNWRGDLVERLRAALAIPASTAASEQQAGADEPLTDEQYQSILEQTLSDRGMRRYRNGDPITLNATDLQAIVDDTRTALTHRATTAADQPEVVKVLQRALAAAMDQDSGPKWTAEEIAAACVKAGIGILECNGLLATLKATITAADQQGSTASASVAAFGYAVEQADGHVTFFKEDPAAFRQKKWTDVGTFVHTLYSGSAPAPNSDAARPELTVWEGAMPESNGKLNFTAILHRKDAEGFDMFSGGFTIARSEYPDRVRYEADKVRWLIGERAERPEIWDSCYDHDKHSDYVAPVRAAQAVDSQTCTASAVDSQKSGHLNIKGAAQAQAGDIIPEQRNILSVERRGDQSATVVLRSCRAASAFITAVRAAMAAPANSTSADRISTGWIMGDSLTGGTATSGGGNV